LLANPYQICYIGSRGTISRNNNTKGVSNMIKDPGSNYKNEMCQYGTANRSKNICIQRKY